MAFPRQGRSGFTSGNGVVIAQRFLGAFGSTSAATFGYIDETNSGGYHTGSFPAITDSGSAVVFHNGASLTANAGLTTSGEWVVVGETAKTAAYNVGGSDAVIPTDTNTTGAFTVTMRSSPTSGSVLHIIDTTDTWDTANLTVGRNGKEINGAAADYVATTEGGWLLCWYDGTGWWIREI